MHDTMNGVRSDGRGQSFERIGSLILRYGLVMMLVWIGALKFAKYEADGVKMLATTSPFLSWGYSVASVQGFAEFLGVIEITLGILIALRAFAPKLSAIGSFGAAIMSLITLSLLFTTPGVWQMGYGFPFLSGMPGGFLAKDVLMLGAALWTGGEALIAASAQSR
ncbi:MAG: DUF417 family protein [Gemmatimonadaceae bacterium]